MKDMKRSLRIKKLKKKKLKKKDWPATNPEKKKLTHAKVRVWKKKKSQLNMLNYLVWKDTLEKAKKLLNC
jgi:hypothetical protein